MNFSKENIDPKKEPNRRKAIASFSNSKKTYWKTGERSSRIAILKHWATLTTIGIGLIATIVVTALFYRENKGTYYKSKFLSPSSLTKSLEESSESNPSGFTPPVSYEEYNPAVFSPTPTFPLETNEQLPSLTKEVVERKEQQVEEIIAVENQTSSQTRLKEELSFLADYVSMTGLTGNTLAVPSLINPLFEPKLASTYFDQAKKYRFLSRFRVGAEVGFGLSILNVRDARSDDSQVVGDVKVRPELAKSYGFMIQAEILPHFSIGTGIFETSFRSEIIPRFLPDTTGSGFPWPPPPEEEHNEEEEHGSGQNVIQLTEGGYDIVTNAGVTHVSHDMDEDLSILNGSKEYFTYYSIPLQLNYSVRFRKFNFDFGTGVNYNHLKHSYAQFNVLDDNKFSSQKSEIIGLKNAFISQHIQLGVQYKLTYNLSLGASIKSNYAWSTMNENTPFNTRLNSWWGMAGVYYNF